MLVEPVDVAVIGAGPAGLAAATRAAGAGLSVVLLDEQETVGGQIYRAIERSDAQRREILGPDYVAGAALAEAFARSGARYEPNASVWQVTRERSVHYLKDGKTGSFEAKRVVLATGALERPFPIPGWTLPGVLTAGSAGAGWLWAVALSAWLAIRASGRADSRAGRHHAS
jgi:thioredoxin reductase